MNILITGPPRIGKTTLLLKIFNYFKSKGYNICGFISEEYIKGKFREGFDIKDLKTGKKGILARREGIKGPKISRYRVNLEDIKKVGLNSLKNYKVCDIIIIDEIGPMECLDNEFNNKIEEILNSGKIVIASVHWKKQAFFKKYKKRKDTEIIYLDENNREYVYDYLIKKIERLLKWNA